MSEKDNWKKLARTIIRAGPLPFPITDALISILKMVVTEDEGEFISIAFRRPNVNIDQIKKKTAKHYNDAQVEDYLNTLMNNGVITGVPSRSTGIIVYHLMPFFPGIFEFQMMKGEKGEKQKKLAKSFDTIFGELSDVSQANYGSLVEQFKNFPAMDRVVPVEEEISEISEVKSDVILPFEVVHKILEGQDIF